MECRQLLPKDLTHVHNEFLLAVLTKCHSVGVTQGRRWLAYICGKLRPRLSSIGAEMWQYTTQNIFSIFFKFDELQ